NPASRARRARDCASAPRGVGEAGRTAPLRGAAQPLSSAAAVSNDDSDRDRADTGRAAARSGRSRPHPQVRTRSLRPTLRLPGPTGPVHSHAVQLRALQHDPASGREPHERDRLGRALGALSRETGRQRRSVRPRCRLADLAYARPPARKPYWVGFEGAAVDYSEIVTAQFSCRRSLTTNSPFTPTRSGVEG